jgi:hypothetical protein
MALIREADLLAPISGYTRRQGYTRQSAELPFYEYRIDLYGLSGQTGRTIAVELKLYKWQRALEQALLYQLCADFVLIAMPEQNLSRVNVDEVALHGIGLIGVGSDRCRLELPARQSSEVREHYKRYYVELLKGRPIWQTVRRKLSSESEVIRKKNT